MKSYTESAGSGDAAAVHDTAPAHNNGDWLTVREAGAIARVSSRRIHAAVRRGELRAACVDGRGRLVLHRVWVNRWLSQLAGCDASDARGVA